MTDANFYTRLERAFEAKPRKPFLLRPDKPAVSFGEMARLSARLAAKLHANGLAPGDRLLVQVEKSAENVALYLAALKAGAIYVPLNTAYTAEDLSYFIEDADPVLIVWDTAREEDARQAAQDRQILTLDRDGVGSLMEDLPPQAKGMAPREPDDTAVILYTSGTTGRSKGAMLTHENLRTNAETLHKLWAFQPEDVLLHALPIFHIHGLLVALHTAILNASSVQFLPAFDPTLVLKTLPDCTVMMGVPTMYTRLLAHEDFKSAVCGNMRLFISGSAPLSEEAFHAFRERSGHCILERYGMSEAGMITSNPVAGERVAGTVGYPLPGVKVRIASPEPATPGEVEIEGPNVFRGYWRNDEKTKEAFTEDGWFKTGDIGILSADGRLSLVGREKDLIIVGGFNVYPKEIETILDAHVDVAESAVVAAPHPDMGEGVVAVLVAAGRQRPTDDELITHLASLARFKQPRKFVWREDLPRNAMGKVQKQILRAEVAHVYA